MFIVSDALRRYRMMKYLEQCESTCFQYKKEESQGDHVIRVSKEFRNWCDDWLDGLDEPIVAAGLFLKYMDSYRRRFSGVKKWNPWLLEVESSKWLGGWSMCGKKNYTSEGCHRIDTIYGGNFSPGELEWRRSNQLVRPTEGGNAMSLDDLNESQMMWNKGCVPNTNFNVVCRRSGCVLATKACAHETFEMNNTRSVRPSRANDVSSLMTLFSSGDVYPNVCNEKRISKMIFG